MLHRLKNPTFILLLLIIMGGFFRFYNLSWGAPYFFHPDERNIASSISQLHFPTQMNPNFFAYGAFPIYLTYFSGVIINSLSAFHLNPTVPFEQAILLLRFFSAILSTLLIPLVYLVGKRLKNDTVGLLGALLVTTSIGIVQFAHFGTFEMWLTFGSLVLFLLGIQYREKPSPLLLLTMTLVFSILVATKVSSIVLLPLFLTFLILSHKKHKYHIGVILLQIVLISLFSVCLYIATNPYVLLDYSSFTNSLSYESAVATGKTKVFYTGEFFNALPVIFPFIRVYPFLLNPIVFVLFFPALLLIFFMGVKKRLTDYLLLLGFFFILFLSQTVLFAQWSRYFIPTLPFIFLIIALGVEESFTKLKKTMRHIQLGFYFLTVIVSFLFATAFVKTVYKDSDTRVTARDWASENLPPSSVILSEVYDLGITPFNENFSNIKLFNTYDLDNNSHEYSLATLTSTLTTSQVIILPSQRVMKTRLSEKQQFPFGNQFYTQLVNGNLGYKLVYKTPCDIWCRLIYWGDPVFSFEQTTAIFDRPTVFIYTKQ